MTAEAMVAIPAYSLAAGRVRGWDSGAFAVPGPYVAAARRAGLRSVLLPPRDGEGDPPGFEDELRPFAALILIGGGDIDPRSYGAEPHARVYGVDRPRDRYESAVLLAAVRSDLPVLAICRGLQVANVAFGGSLLQHLPDHDRGVPHGDPTGEKGVSHVVTAAPGSRLAAASGAGPLPVHSHHHQGIDRLGDGLVAVARSEDGLVEAVEREDGWFLAVQWHPEETAATDPAQQALFDALGAEAVRRSR